MNRRQRRGRATDLEALGRRDTDAHKVQDLLSIQRHCGAKYRCICDYVITGLNHGHVTDAFLILGQLTWPTIAQTGLRVPRPGKYHSWSSLAVTIACTRPCQKNSRQALVCGSLRPPLTVSQTLEEFAKKQFDLGDVDVHFSSSCVNLCDGLPARITEGAWEHVSPYIGCATVEVSGTRGRPPQGMSESFTG